MLCNSLISNRLQCFLESINGLIPMTYGFYPLGAVNGPYVGAKDNATRKVIDAKRVSKAVRKGVIRVDSPQPQRTNTGIVVYKK